MTSEFSDMENIKAVSNKTVVVNSLPATLAHYQKELLEVLHASHPSREVLIVNEGGDQLASTRDKVHAACSILYTRLFGFRKHRGDIFVVVWPLFGFLDIVTWLVVARNNQVVVVYHDPKPLRRQPGTSKLHSAVFAFFSRNTGITALCHTEAARLALVQATGVNALLAPHPILPPSKMAPAVGAVVERRTISDVSKTITVLGQYKAARSITPLVGIARLLAVDYHLQVLGRGWPDVPGWNTTDKFLTEREFQDAIDSSSCVVIPYSHFYQSGVAVRCAESGTPVVAPRHEHIEQVFGANWPGLVDGDTSWAAAVETVCNAQAPSVSTDMAFQAAVFGWRRAISCLSGMN
jgi:hypothetical protein